MEGFALDVEEGEAPLYARIAQAVVADVRRGRLRPGDALPGSRRLAQDLGVHRNTILAALRELELEGWIETAAARATRIRRDLPDPKPRRFAAQAAARSSATIGFELGPGMEDWSSPPPPKGAILMLGGMPDLRLVPASALGRAYRRIVTAPRSAELFGYGDPRGEPALRNALAETLSRTRGLAVGSDDLVVTRGSQMALYLAARAVVRPGDRVAVEALGYRPAWLALRHAGAELVPVAVDGGGIDVDALEAAVERCAAEGRKLRAVYLTPHHQYPTTALLAPGRRIALLELARRHKLALFEDDYDHEFHYEGRPVTPLASADRTGQVVYIGTLSKILAPALRIGFVVAPAPLLERIASLRVVVDRQGDRLLERALAELAADGEIARHARKMRSVYAARRGALAAALEAHLGEHVSFELPRGGIALWLRAPAVDVEAWAAACLERGVVFQTGRRFTFDGSRLRAIRLGFAAETEARLTAGVRKMADALTCIQKERALHRAQR
ncbi:MAG: PLP-dependent aminotransferase family protein [Polyangiaceae bacterium]|nr:PLP-dependent aminotransferase family protein [Polyangiaceae bacterium]